MLTPAAVAEKSRKGLVVAAVAAAASNVKHMGGWKTHSPAHQVPELSKMYGQAGLESTDSPDNLMLAGHEKGAKYVHHQPYPGYPFESP
jgi:hypothetical protein